MDRDFLEKRKKDLNAYLQVSSGLLLVGFILIEHTNTADFFGRECFYCNSEIAATFEVLRCDLQSDQ